MENINNTDLTWVFCVCDLFMLWIAEKNWWNILPESKNYYLTQQRSYSCPLQTNGVLTYILVIYFTFILLINVNENINQHSSGAAPGNLVVTHSSTPLDLTHWIMMKGSTRLSNSDALLHLNYILSLSYTRTHPPNSYSWYVLFCTMYGLPIFHLKLYLNYLCY